METVRNDVEIEQALPDDDNYDMIPTATVLLKTGDEIFTIRLEDNSSADAFFEEINHGGSVRRQG